MWRKRKAIVPESERIIKEPAGARERTMNRAIRLLAAKPRSIMELRERLMEKSWTNVDIVASVIEKLKEYKYLDDIQYATDLAASKLRQKPQGKRRLVQKLSQKKLDRDVVDSAIMSAYEKTPETDLLKSAIEKRIRLKGQPQTRDEIKKFYDHLMRQGFSYSLIRSEMSAVTNSASADETR
jgi:regulatory protein